MKVICKDCYLIWFLIGDEGFCVFKEDGIYVDLKDEIVFYVC